MSESVSLPALGESVTEGTVTRWLKKVGDRVEVDEPLLEVSTDKVDTEIPSPVAGVVEAILVAEDETVEVGTALVTIGDGLDAGAEATVAPHSDATADAVSPPSEVPVERPLPDPETPVEPAESEAAPVEAPPTTPETVAAAPAEIAPAAEVPSTDAPAPTEAPPTEAAPTEAAPTEAAAAAEASTAAARTEAAPANFTTGESLEAEAPDTAEVSNPSGLAPATTITLPTEAPATGVATHDAETPEAETPDAHAGYVTPLVRKLANERGINLDLLTGTGVGGRIRKQDVLEASNIIATTAPAEKEVPAPAATAPPEISALRGTTVPMSRLRKVIAERAVISMQSSAQLTSVVEVDVTLVASLRNRVKDQFLAATGQKLSFLPFFALAATEALASNPIINATIDGDTIVYPPHENIAIAVDTERGLLTPVIRDAATLDLAGFASQIADLAARTRDNKLKPDELAGGTFTLTNTGSRGALFDTPIVFLPQSAILGTGIVAKKPVVISDASGDAIAIRSMVYLALSYDHRIVDGADAARFLVAVKHRLEGGDFEKNLGI